MSKKHQSAIYSARKVHVQRAAFRQSLAVIILGIFILQNILLVLPTAAQKKSAAGSVLSPQISTTVVISQFQVAGVNAADEFLELHNVSNVEVDLNGYRLVYRSASGTSDVAVTDWTTQTLIPAGGFYLVTNTAGYDDTATADKTFTSGGTGQWAGASGGLALRQGAANSGTIIDSVGYGSATNAFVETATTTSPASNASKVRDNSGCKDTDNNSTDFLLLNPSAPRNSTAAAVICGGGGGSTNPSGTGAANPNSVAAGNSTLLTVTVTPGTNPASTGITVSGDLSSIGGIASQTFYDDGTNGDVAAGDNVFSYNATVVAGTSPGGKTLAVTITDGQSRTGNTTISLTVAAPPVQPQPLPFSQNWSDTNLITTDNDWSGVPGIVGYRGDNLTGGTGTDPQTILTDGSATPVNVTANQTNPNTITSGGNYEFEIADPVVAFQGSGTASAPHLVINLDTTGNDNVTVFYNLRDIDGSADDAVQSVALQYRVGNTGNYTNVPAAFVADATTGPNLATLVTAVAVALPAAVDNQPLVQLRIITANAVGSDEFVGIDDISVVSGGTIPLSASGSAMPNQVESGSAVLLKVAVNPGTNPASTGITVSGDLTSIGGAANQTFYDDGTNGDVTAGDNIFSYNATIPASSSGGNQTLPITVSDAQTRTATTSISLTVIAAADPQEHLVMGNPSGATTDVNNPTNYLLPKNQYVVGYHRDRGIPNWVSWHLDSSWLGSAPRQDDFRPDPALPAGWYQVMPSDYTGSGFDRGHHTPSGDRTRSIPDNSATFLMTNMMPQAPDNNQGPWEQLESFSRTLVGQGNELYILGAGVGTGGTGSNGGVTTTIAGGKVTVPAYTWKVILVLPVGDNDVARVDTNTRTIAVIMPNNQGIRTNAWQKYLATVDQVENLTGYDFFSNVPVDIQNVIESRLDAASQMSAPQNVAGGSYTNLDVTDTPNKSLSGNITVTGNLNLGGTNLSTGNFCVTLGANATVSRTYGYVNNCVEKQFTAAAAKPSVSLSGKNEINAAGKTDGTDAPAEIFEYPVGTNNGYSPVTANVTAVAESPTSLSVRAVQGVQPNAPDANLALKRYWTLTENGDLTADLTFKYLDQDVPVGISESSFTLQRYEGTFTEIPATIDPAANTAATTGGISQFSDWTLLAPSGTTAARAQVGGRVTSNYGRGIAGATIVFTDGNGSTFTARTNPFGYYRLEDIPTGITYVVDVRHKSYRFTPQVVNLTENLDGLDFTGTSGY